jgi:ATP phosphoribosyltransferase
MVRSPLKTTDLKLAIPRGSLMDSSLDLLDRAGFKVTELRGDQRKLVFEVGEGRTIITTRPSDVPVYVEYGAADAGIVGKDVLMEGSRNVYEVLDLGFGRCRIVYAVAEGREPEAEELRHLGEMRIATRYPEITRRYFEAMGIQVDVIDLRGSIELAPQVDLADGIVDLTSSGETLRQNRLVEKAQIASCSARLIANRVSFKLKAEMLDKLRLRFEEVLEG